MHRLINRDYDQLLRRERSLLESLRVHLARLDAPDADLALLRSSLQQLEELFLLVVVGEFNAGKTAFINALLGSRLLAEGVTPTTSQIHLLRYGPALHQEPSGEDYRIIQAPVEWLREINLVDTPGTNAVIQRHQQITEHFVPRSDLVLFVTSVDRPFSESERQFLERIREWGKKIIIVLNKVDLIEQPDDLEQIVEYVRSNARHLLGVEPRIFPVSARLALQAKQAAQAAGTPPQGDLWQRSRFEPLESYILTTLDAGERVRLKLENPLGVASRLLDRYDRLIADRQEVLKGDFQTLDTIEEQLQAYESDMRRDFKFQRSRVDNVLYEMAERGDSFFEETLRIGRVFDLLNSEKVRGEFERQVIADTSRQIERHVNELIDWLVERDYRQWRAVMEYLSRRASQHADRMVGQVSGDFEFNRQAMLASVGREAQRVVDSYDREAESLALAQEVQKAIIQTAAVEVGALGLGALLVALLHTTVLDITGIVGASAIAALGLYVLPYRRSRVKAELRERINTLRSQLEAALERQFERELAASVQRIREAIAPYTRFVRVEREKLEKLEAELQAARVEVTALRQAVQALGQTAEPAS
ncbi:MAG TPA: dynamin family protein [Caldilineaceae bacterium]|nr:dynamin family protein [Caldilineaceae bacterium]